MVKGFCTSFLCLFIHLLNFFLFIVVQICELSASSPVGRAMLAVSGLCAELIRELLAHTEQTDVEEELTLHQRLTHLLISSKQK